MKKGDLVWRCIIGSEHTELGIIISGPTSMFIYEVAYASGIELTSESILHYEEDEAVSFARIQLTALCGISQSFDSQTAYLVTCDASTMIQDRLLTPGSDTFKMENCAQKS